ncbi:MAG: SitI3 family protein [Geminicoccaceae bacterium]
MSLDYTLYLSTTKTPDQIVERLGFLSNADDVISSGEPGLATRGASADHPVVQADIEETFGFLPTVKIMFSLDKFHEDLPGLQAKLARSVVALLVEEEGDAVLVFSGGAPVLKRTDGHLYLNENWSSWKTRPPEDMALDYQLVAL